MTDLLQVILDMRNGAVAMDCNNKFNEVLKSVIETGGKGELNIKFMVRPSKMGMGGTVVEVETEHECKVKKPELAVGKSFFFITKEGDMSRQDPAQEAMFELEQEEETKHSGK